MHTIRVRTALQVLTAAAIVLHLPRLAWAQQDSAPAAQAGTRAGSAVVVRGDTLFWIEHPLGPFEPVDRAQAIAGRLTRIIGDPIGRRDSIYLSPGETTTDVMVGDVVITTVTDADAEAAGVSRDSVAATRAVAIAAALQRQSFLGVVRAVALGLLFTLAVAVAFLVILRLLRRFLAVIERQLRAWQGTQLRGLRFQRLEILSAERLTAGLIAVARGLRVVIIALLVFYLVPVILSFFPWTAGLSRTVFAWVLGPLQRVGRNFLVFLPDLFAIVVILAIAYYVNRFIRFFFMGIQRGAITLPGFYRDWADPTYKIVRFLVIVFTVISIYPYLPGSETAAFRGISIFLGVLVSFSSASAVGNIIAGVVMTYMRPFQVGDRVKIADTVGDVVRKTLLVTRVRTTKNVEVTIPNSMVLSSHIINFSSAVAQHGLVLHTSVTIGYDAPWRTVHELLIKAAEATAGILREPRPFVLQTGLNDFHVTYELNAYTDRPNEMATLYARLQESIQDRFNEAGVEIMSPHYSALRDGNQTTIPAEYLSKSYRPPAFRLLQTDQVAERRSEAT